MWCTSATRKHSSTGPVLQKAFLQPRKQLWPRCICVQTQCVRSEVCRCPRCGGTLPSTKAYTSGKHCGRLSDELTMWRRSRKSPDGGADHAEEKQEVPRRRICEQRQCHHTTEVITLLRLLHGLKMMRPQKWDNVLLHGLKMTRPQKYKINKVNL
ncbi:hypothetical protein SKAU_G00151640 [Synaphobranchus kaupii]|uniref:Uncharacterized protein n=1 Tax=Synaphobranchus kaupii TaxID=118154 RepID=A0A9Q1FGS1_SYNKA|nr:hypothetical protein SKAU_G00151640 [Synaphobranchus kaupii]